MTTGRFQTFARRASEQMGVINALRSRKGSVINSGTIGVDQFPLVSFWMGEEVVYIHSPFGDKAP